MVFILKKIIARVLITFLLWKLSSDSVAEGEIYIFGLSFQINGGLSDDGVICAKEITSYTADSLRFVKLLQNYDGAHVLAVAMENYKDKLNDYCIA